MGEDEKEVKMNFPSSCRDCTTQNLFVLINKLIYALIGLSILNTSPEVFKSIMGLIK